MIGNKKTVLSSIQSNVEIYSIVMLFYISLINCQDFYGGYFSYHPEYLHDLPAPDHYMGPVPFGLPMGGFSMNGKGPAFGLQAYIVRGVIPFPLTVQSISNVPEFRFPTPIQYLEEFGSFFKIFKFWRRRR
jgi:hypothetical protein